MTTLVEQIDDVAGFLSRPGKYHTTTGHQAFGVLQSLAWHPRLRMGQQLFFPEGSILFAEVLSGLSPNIEKSGWGTTDDYYERRLRDYDNWEVAFWRETIQNSRDAGATQVDLVCEEDVFEDPENGERTPCVRCVATDNGGGMSYETLMSAFFRRGGSQKVEGSVGGFGDAKNLILTPWLGYEVHTRDSIVRGRHEDLFPSLSQESGAPYLHGTKVTVWMPNSKTTTPEHAQFIIEQSSLNAIRFTVNGSRVKGSLPQGKLVKELPIKKTYGGQVVGDLLIYHSNKSARHGVYVRSHGIYMYEVSGFEGEFKGVVTIEVNAPPIDVFTTKRDSLSTSSSARADVQETLRALTSDPKQLLKAKRDKKQIVFRGSGSIAVREGVVSELAAEVAAKVDLSRLKRTKQGTVTMSKGEAEEIARILRAVAGTASSAQGGGEEMDVLNPLPSTFQTLVSQGEFADVEQVTGALRMSIWKPDFYLYQNISPWKMPKSLHPETMSKKYHDLLRVWTELCRFVLVQVGLFEPFGVGWVFDTEYDPKTYGESVIGAAYGRFEGQHWLLLNPVEIDRTGSDDFPEFKLVGDRLDLRSERSREELVSLAVHEVTHMQGFMSHTDAYASAITDNMKAAYRASGIIKTLIREAKGAAKAEREEAKAARAEGGRTKRTSRSRSSWHDVRFEWDQEGLAGGYFQYARAWIDDEQLEGTPFSVYAEEDGRYVARIWDSNIARPRSFSNGKWWDIGTVSDAKTARRLCELFFRHLLNPKPNLVEWEVEERNDEGAPTALRGYIDDASAVWVNRGSFDNYTVGVRPREGMDIRFADNLPSIAMAKKVAPAMWLALNELETQ